MIRGTTAASAVMLVYKTKPSCASANKGSDTQIPLFLTGTSEPRARTGPLWYGGGGVGSGGTRLSTAYICRAEPEPPNPRRAGSHKEEHPSLDPSPREDHQQQQQQQRRGVINAGGLLRATSVGCVTVAHLDSSVACDVTDTRFARRAAIARLDSSIAKHRFDSADAVEKPGSRLQPRRRARSTLATAQLGCSVGREKKNQIRRGARWEWCEWGGREGGGGEGRTNQRPHHAVE